MEALIHHFGSLVWYASPAAASALLAAIWQGAVLAGGVALGLRLLPRLSAAARSLIWLNVFALLVLLHGLPLFLAHGAASWSGFAVAQNAPVHLNPWWSVALAAVWAVLSLWKLLELLLSAVRLRAVASRSVAVDVGQAIQVLLNAGRSSVLCVSDEVERPCVLGFFRPRILIPPALLEKLSPLELQLVVQHEMEHLRRGDDWSNLLQKVGLVLFPLNPVLLWVERQLCAERELACDDRVLRSSGGAKAYAICLTHLAEYSLLYRKLSLVLGAWERQSELVRRVHRILRAPMRQLTGRAAAAAMTGVVLAAVGCAMLLARSPQLVSFTPGVSPVVEASAVQAPDFGPALRPASGSIHVGVMRAHASNMSGNAGDVLGKEQLVKAIMPARSSDAPRRLRNAVVKRTSPARVLPQRQQLMVLTEWRDIEGTPQVVIAVDQRTRSSYAAVQMAGGWVIFQI